MAVLSLPCLAFPYLNLPFFALSGLTLHLSQLKDQGEELAALQITLSEEKEANEVLEKQKKSLREMMVRPLSCSMAPLCISFLLLFPSLFYVSFVPSPFNLLFLLSLHLLHTLYYFFRFFDLLF
jgi:uncharacterized membrane protein